MNDCDPPLRPCDDCRREEQVRQSVERALEQSARGEVVSLGDFTQYA